MEKQELYLAIVTIFVAVLGGIFTALQYSLLIKKRKDDIFNLRYKFYSDVSKIWISTSNLDNPPLDITDLVPIAEKAEFLFGKKISKHILSLENKRATHDLFPDDDFSNPFHKYLKLK